MTLLVLFDDAFVRHTIDDWNSRIVRFLRGTVLARVNRASTCFIFVRTSERRLALCARCLSLPCSLASLW